MKGHIRRRGDRSWAIVVDAGRNATGKRCQHWHSIKGTRKDAERELTRLLHAMNNGGYIEPSRLSVAEFLRKWLDDCAKSNVAGKTFERYEQLVLGHLNPKIGHVPLAKLHPLHIQDCYSEKLEHGRKDGKGGLSPQTVVHLHRVLRTALNQAVKWQMLARNPADAVEPPRAPRREMRALDEDGTAKLLGVFTRSRLYTPILIAVTTGLRRGELLGLRWRDIELDSGHLSISQALEQTHLGVAFKQPKTPRSRRTVALPQLAIEALRRHKAQQAEERLAFGPGYQDGGLVFACPDGTPWRPDAFSWAFAAQVRQSGLPHVRFHDLRHSHASQLLRQGVNAKVVSERLGHASVGFTLDVYSHVLPGMQDDAARRIDAALRPVLTNK
jgi:integrase